MIQFFVKGFLLKIVKQLVRLYKAVNYFANISWDEEAENRPFFKAEVINGIYMHSLEYIMIYPKRILSH